LLPGADGRHIGVSVVQTIAPHGAFQHSLFHTFLGLNVEP
jgi:hypothetical protein